MPSFSSLTPVLVPANGDMSQATVSTVPIDMRQAKMFAVFSRATGSPTGSLQLLGSVQPTPPPIGDAAWAPIGSGATAISAAGTTVYDVASTGALWVMLTYTRTSGSGTLAVSMATKG